MPNDWMHLSLTSFPSQLSFRVLLPILTATFQLQTHLSRVPPLILLGVFLVHALWIHVFPFFAMNGFGKS